MLGRVAIDNPAIFWDADRYFYGLETNPCQNRRQVLERYASYLEVLYPKRCCDIDEEITHRIPVPTIVELRPYCTICQDKYGKENGKGEDVKEIAMKVIEKRNKVMIASRILGRSFKPIRNLFHGLPGGKVFLHTLDKASRDKSIRNCGPGYVLRRVMDQVPPRLLDQNFILTEDIENATLP